MNDMVKYARFLLCGGLPLWSKETFALARKNYTQGASESRALGYLFVDERYVQTGGLFPVGSVGHCGHTGQSVFVHPESGLFVVVLSDATKSVMQKYGVEKYAHTMNMRAAIHSAIKADLNA